MWVYKYSVDFASEFFATTIPPALLHYLPSLRKIKEPLWGCFRAFASRVVDNYASPLLFDFHYHARSIYDSQLL